jgi:hypothetical protein
LRCKDAHSRQPDGNLDLIELPEPSLADETGELLCSLCPAEALARFQATKNVDFSLEVAVNGRLTQFRANLFHAGRGMRGVGWRRRAVAPAAGRRLHRFCV